MGEKLKITNLPLSGAVEVQAKPITDDRGWFSRWFCQEELKAINYNRQIEQINSSFTASKGVIRGLHFQFAPNMEDKIVRCIQGSVFDVIVDGNDVSKSKPNPEVFLKAAQHMGVSPQHCVVLEDAPAGVEAALTANMKVIGLGDASELQKAHLVLDNAKNLSFGQLNQIKIKGVA